MSREAMTLALDALEQINELSKGPNAIALPGEIDDAMDALRAALDEPPVLWYHPLSGRVRFEKTSKWIPLYK